MKYNFLAAWAKDFESYTAVLDKVFLYRNDLYLSMVKQPALVIVLSAQDSFIYKQNETSIPREAISIWPQLRNSAIESISISDNDRIIHIRLCQKDIYQEVRRMELICELMPPKPNVILIKADSKQVLDALYKYSLADNPMRMVLVNQPYFPPKTSFVPDITQSISIPAEYDTKDLNEYFLQRHRQILAPKVRKNMQEDKKRILKKEIQRLNKKLSSQEKDLENAMKMDYYQACAEAIKPNMHMIKPGQSEFQTTNYLDPELKEITVPLLTDKSAQQNLNFYIKKYHKAKNGKNIIELNIKRTQDEIDAVEKLVQRVEDGEEIDLETRDKSGDIVHKLNQTERILQLRLPDGWHIYIGRKAKENDFITTKIGKAQDWWFHSRIYRGAHVLLKNPRKQEVPTELLRACCGLAAWYSQAKFSVNVPVDYTQIRYVRKPKGSAPGFVTYTNYKTIFATPMDIRKTKEDLGL
jgi:predicted ribosome quality control (RQC) complex YloA/Tae2 family protein